MILYSVTIILSVVFIVHVLNPSAPARYACKDMRRDILAAATSTTTTITSSEKRRQDVLDELTNVEVPPRDNPTWMHLIVPLLISALGIYRLIYPCINLSVMQMHLGSLFLFSGVLLRIASFQALGPYFTFHIPEKVSQSHPLIETGPYRLLLHPGYLGMFFAFAGFTLLLTTHLMAIGGIIVMLLGLMFLRIYDEEVKMNRLFPDRYTHYKRNKYRILPGIF